MKRYFFILLVSIFLISLLALSCNKRTDVVKIATIPPSDIAIATLFEEDEALMPGVPKFLYYVEGLKKEDIKEDNLCSKELTLTAPNILSYNCNEELKKDTIYTHKINLPNLKANQKYTLEVSADLVLPFTFLPSLKIHKVGEKEQMEESGGEAGKEADLDLAKMKEFLKDHIDENEQEELYRKIDTLGSIEAVKQFIAENFPEDAEPAMPDAYLSDVTASPIPATKPAILAYTFTPDASGDYEAILEFSTTSLNYGLDQDGKIKEAAVEEATIENDLKNIPYSFILRFYKELGNDEAHYGTAWKVGSLTPEEITELRQLYIEGLYSIYDVYLNGSVKLSQLFEFDGPFNSFFKALNGYDLFAKKNENEPLLKENSSEDDKKSIIIDEMEELIKRKVKEIYGEKDTEGLTSEISSEVNIKITKGNEALDLVGDLRIGNGHEAKTGILRERAFDEFSEDLKTKRQPSPESQLVMKFINKEETLEKELNHTITAGLGLDSFSIKNTNTIMEQTKLEKNSTTLVIRYEYVDSPTKFTLFSNEEFSKNLKGSAKELFKENPDAFLERYGDYFVSGYRYGARFEAYLTITASSQEKIKSIENQFDLTIKQFELNDELQKKLTETLKETKTSLTVITQGIDKGSSTDYTVGNYDTLLTRLNEFIKAAQSSENFEYVPLYAKLKRYRNLEEFSSLPNKINVPSELLVKSRAFVRAYNKMGAYYNAVMGIPESNIYDSNVTRTAWSNTYNDYKNKVSSQFSRTLSSVESVQKELNNLVGVSENFRRLIERWGFYETLMVEQRKDSISFQQRPNTKSKERNFANRSRDYLESDDEKRLTWEQGLRNYGISKEIDKKLRENICEAGYTIQPRGYSSDTWLVKKDLPESRFVRYWNIWSGSNWDEIYQDQIRDQKNNERPHIGRNGYSWFFRRGGGRAAYWRYTICFIDMPKDEWPFTGLEKR